MKISEYKDVQIITSRQNPSVLYTCKLAEKKYRTAEGKFRFDGIKLFEEAMASGVIPELILIKESSFERITDAIGDQLKAVDVAKYKSGLRRCF